MRASGILSWLVNELFPVFGSVLGILASFGAASFEQVYYYFYFFFDSSPFTWTATNLFTGLPITIPELGSFFYIPIISDIVSWLNNVIWGMLYKVVYAFGLVNAPFALAFIVPFLFLFVIFGLYRFFRKLL